MKNDIHPENYRPVVFHDTASGEEFLIPSTVETEQTTTYDGKEYPYYEVEISSASHPFYTGQEKTLDTAGRVEKFKQRREQAQVKQESKSKKDKKEKSQENASSSEGSISIDAHEVESNN